MRQLRPHNRTGLTFDHTVKKVTVVFRLFNFPESCVRVSESLCVLASDKPSKSWIRYSNWTSWIRFSHLNLKQQVNSEAAVLVWTHGYLLESEHVKFILRGALQERSLKGSSSEHITWAVPFITGRRALNFQNKSLYTVALLSLLLQMFNVISYINSFFRFLSCVDICWMSVLAVCITQYVYTDDTLPHHVIYILHTIYLTDCYGHKKQLINCYKIKVCLAVKSWKYLQ